MHTRVYSQLRFLPSLVGGVLALLIGFNVAQAQTTTLATISFSSETYTRGYTYSTQPSRDFRLAVAPNSLSGPATVKIEKLDATGLPAWNGRTLVGSAYRVTVAGVESLTHPLTFNFAIPATGFVAYIGKLDQAENTWEQLGSTLNSDGSRIQAADDELSFTVAAFQHKTLQSGVATYYGTYGRTTSLTMVAASNTFPKGQLVRVTNIENGKMVTVRIVDTGGFKFPRVIDLSTPAFAKIQPTWKGLAKVRVVKATPWNGPSATSPDPTPSGQAPTLDGSTPPSTAAKASIVVDVTTGQKLLGKNTTLPLPIASLTKLMTAAVVMDTKPNLNAVFTYNSTLDKAQYCSCLNLANGEKVLVKDLFFASLVGSANNATLALVRSTGLSRTEFVSRMNAKAKAFGLKNTYYVEPTGLNPGNVSTPEDVARMMRLIPNASPTIRRMLATGSYWFRSQNNVCLSAYKQTDGTCKHSFVTTNKLFGKTSYAIVAAKTGYIDESLHTFALRGRDSRGHEIIVVLLRTQVKADSFNGANALMNWIFQHAIWT